MEVKHVPMNSDGIIDQAVRRIVAGFQPERIILFGSRARGTADERSDVDILVIMPFSGSRRELAWQIDKSLYGLGLARDVVVLRQEEFDRDREVPGTIARPAAMEGKVLYERAA